MTNAIRRGVYVLPLMAPIFLSACVSQSSYNSLQSSYNDLLGKYQQATAQIARLQAAVKYTVDSDLLFASGSWQMRPSGKDIIARLAAKLAPTQQNSLVVTGYTDNAPIGPALQAQGVTSNQMLSQKRAEGVMQFLISQGLNPGLITARGLGETDPVASNDTAQGRAKNRRVELSLAGS